MNPNKLSFIPRPLVRTNQWVIVISVLLSWVLHRDWILLAPLAAGLGGLFGFNPVIRAAKRFLRKRPDQYTPEDPSQQKFNQIISVVLLSLGLLSSYAHLQILFYVFSAMVAVAAFVAILGFCVGCFIRYQWTQYRYRRQSGQPL